MGIQEVLHNSNAGLTIHCTMGMQGVVNISTLHYSNAGLTVSLLHYGNASSTRYEYTSLSTRLLCVKKYSALEILKIGC